MKNVPKVSVIIPCYNAMPFIEGTLASVKNQTYDNLEIIIIDDGSTDGTHEFLQQLNDERIIVKSNKTKGACAARNYGFEISTGAYIQFLDADDLLSTNKLEQQVELLESHPSKIAVCSTKHFNTSIENGTITDKDFMFSTDQPAEFLLNLYGAHGDFNMVQTSAWLTPRHLIEKAGFWDESLSKDQDGEFFCRVVMQSEGVIYEPTVLNYYRKHSNGSNIANQKKRKHIRSQLQALNSKADQLRTEANTTAYKSAMALQYKFLGINAYPEFKDISNEALLISDSFGGSDYLPVLGGKLIESIKTIFGWKAAKQFRRGIHKLLK